MKSWYLLVLLVSGAQTLCVTIESVPGVGVDGTIQTELERTVSLVCRPGSAPDLPPREGWEEEEELVWLRNGAVVSLKAGNQKGSSSVCVTPIIHGDNGATFTCHLRRNASIQASVTLNVTYPPTLSGSEEVSVEEASPLVLRCDVFANPPVMSPLWTLNGSVVDLSAGGFTVTNDGFVSQLSASSAERSLHEGRYQCTADSPVYGAKTRVFQVTVTDKTTKFPLVPIIAGVVVVCLTGLFAIISRWSRITKCCK
ncbi:transmembrane and immunoglobulin domain-containing protein 1 isoform X2 [Dunckerocampus dactyliophorus]|uniref:transmembrane and immunoglobulin domain-containing protein 1 isoform X2 n=1 Tax=Dunckerocampus dactyliophorus TaxID=161453 RepID=UPI002404FC82|nr:transmembrane and immunoglobulin domain-containing protein 1 isoform X2 [Dunckerocampus dactyliophorus]